MSILTQFLPTVNAQIGEIKTVLKNNLFISANTTAEASNVLTDVDGGVWLRAGNSYLRSQYPQLANTIGVHGGVNYINSGQPAGASPATSITQIHYSTGTREWRWVSANGEVYGNASSGYISNGRNKDGSNVLYDIIHNSEGTGLAGNTWAIAGLAGVYRNDLEYYVWGGRFYDSDQYPIQARGVAWGNNKFVLRGSWGRVWYSLNTIGTSWQLYADPNSQQCDPLFKGYRGIATNPPELAMATASCIRYGANMFSVMSDDRGVVSFSANGVSWPGLPGTFYYWGVLRDIKYANNVWVVVGDGDAEHFTPANALIGTSTDGVHWTRRSNPTFRAMDTVTFGGNVWVAGGENGNIIFSTNNGTTWTNVVASNTAAYINHIEYAANINNSQMFCYVGASGAIGITTNANADFINANSWIATSQNSGGQIIYSVKYLPGQNVFIAGNNNGDILTSTDGRAWIPRGRASPGQGIRRFHVANGKVILGGFSGYVYSADIDAATDANNFTGFPGIANTITHCAYGDNLYVATGWAGLLVTSTDGVTWNRTSPNFAKTHQSFVVRSVVYANNTSSPHKWIAVGDAGIIKLSPNGFNWSGQQNVQTANSMLSVAYGQNTTNSYIYVTGGNGGNLSISDDGIYWTSVNATTSSIQSIIYGNGKFLYGAVGGGLASSPDGINWTDASNTTAELNSAAYGNNIYVIVGNGAIARRSEDGVYWQSVNANSVQNLNHVEYLNNIFVAVGGSGNIVTSTDGTSWIRQTSNNSTANILYACGYGGTQSLYVYGGQSGNIATSTDAVTWIGRTSGTSSEIRAIASSPSLFVYATLSGGLASSTDGITWTARTSGTTNSFYSAMFANNIYIVAGQNGNLITSTDGTSWTGRVSNTTQIIYTLSYDANTKLYIYGAGAGVYGTSTDAVTWLANTQQTTTNIFGTAFGSNANVSVFCGSTGMIRHSYDGQKYSGSNTASIIRTMAYGNGVYLHAGDSGVIRTSTDGIFWQNRSAGTANAFYASIYADGKFLISGGSGNTHYSVDNGQIWIPVNIGTANLQYSIAYGNGLFVRGGQNGNVGTSTDGITWAQSNVTTVNALSNLIYSITFSNTLNTFFYTGAGGRSAVSTDGNNWTFVNPWANTTAQINFASVYGNNEFLVVGNGGTPIKSIDGNNWSTTKSNTIIADVAYGANVWVAVGANGNVRTSTDGVYWSVEDANANVTSPINWTGIGDKSNLLCAEYLNGRFLIGGEYGTFKYSTDGYNWTDAKYPRELSVTGIAYGQGKYVIVGNGGFIATSTDLRNWDDVYYNRSNSQYGTFPNLQITAKSNLATVVYHPTLNIFAAGGANRTYITSTDGINWVDRTDETKMKVVNDFINHLSIGDNDKLVYVGNRSLFATSTDGVRWGGCGLTGNINFTTITSITYDANNKLYCVSNGSNFSTSTDLWHWDRSQHRSPVYGWASWQAVNEIRAMEWGPTSANGNLTVAVGPWWNTMMFSHLGGRLWNSSSFDDPFTFSAIFKMAYGNNTFVAVGNNGRILRSNDGIHYTKVDNAPVGSRAMRNVSYGNGLWTIVGDSTIVFTRDFINWTRGTTNPANLPLLIYTSCMNSPNISLVGSSTANIFYTFKNDPSRMMIGYQGFDEDAEFYIPQINVTNYTINANFVGGINFANSSTFGGGNSYMQVAVYVKAK